MCESLEFRVSNTALVANKLTFVVYQSKWIYNKTLERVNKEAAGATINMLKDVNV